MRRLAFSVVVLVVALTSCGQGGPEFDPTSSEFEGGLWAKGDVTIALEGSGGTGGGGLLTITVGEQQVILGSWDLGDGNEVNLNGGITGTAPGATGAPPFALPTVATFDAEGCGGAGALVIEGATYCPM